MSDKVPNRDLKESTTLNKAYMNRLFCSTKERIAFILYSAFGGVGLGKYDVGSDIWLYKIYGISPTAFAKAQVGLGIYDMVNDPVSAAIIDNMRSRWGKFKPFQFLSLIPSLITGIYTCFLPLIAEIKGKDEQSKLVSYMILCYVNETIGAFFGGGGYINNVFTPNPNERTSLLVSSKFVAGLIEKLPQQIVGVLMDLIANNVIKIGLAKTFVAFKTVVWVWATLPTIMWYIMSKERVPQSEKAPNPIKGIFAIFRNKPLLINVLTDFVDGINVGTGEDLYYNDVLNFNLLPTVGGIAGSPISYASYAFVPKFRARFSTKTLFFMNRGSILISETAFFLFGLIGGKEKGLYLKRVPMTLIFAAGNVLEMTFYALGKVIGNEINFEVLDYFEWQNGYRLEATISLVRNYITKVKNIILNVINAKLLESWAGYQIGEDAIQTADTKWRLFIIAFGPRLIFDALSLIPMVFYNIDKNTRNKMYLDLEKMRAKRAQEELERVQLLDS
ncbi:MAG TPA: hypothetical protein GXZ23_02660 [Clostridiales bacterium]|nr:hypothetical protein [Clostridiales bacterium]